MLDEIDKERGTIQRDPPPSQISSSFLTDSTNLIKN